MASDRLVLHVTPNGDEGWKIEAVDVGSFSAGAGTKAEAEDIAKRYARDRQPSQVRVHKADGTLEYESTYGDDPAATPG